MSRKLFSIILAFVMVLSLSGCGNMISLNDEEEEKIAMYSASIVRKYNKGEDQAVSFYGPKSQAIYDAINNPKSLSGTAEAENTSGAVSDGIDTAENPGNSVKENSDANTSDANSSESSSDASNQNDDSLNPSSEKNLSEIIGVNGLSFAVSGVSAVDNYTVAGVMDLTPRSGDKFMEVDISCTNNTASDIKVDFSQLNITYMCTFGGTTVYSSEALAPNGLSTFDGTVKAGSSENLVLLFDFSSDVLSGSLTGYQIKAKKSDGTYLVSF